MKNRILGPEIHEFFKFFQIYSSNFHFFKLLLTIILLFETNRYIKISINCPLRSEDQQQMRSSFTDNQRERVTFEISPCSIRLVASLLSLHKRQASFLGKSSKRMIACWFEPHPEFDLCVPVDSKHNNWYLLVNMILSYIIVFAIVFLLHYESTAAGGSYKRSCSSLVSPNRKSSNHS